MNFQLKDDNQGGALEFRTGAYQDANAGDTATCGSNIGDIKALVQRHRRARSGVLGGRQQRAAPRDQRVPEPQLRVRQRQPDHRNVQRQRRGGHQSAPATRTP